MTALANILRLARFLYVQRTHQLVVPDSPHFDETSAEAFIALLNRATSYLEFWKRGIDRRRRDHGRQHDLR
jgi:hypothetical protein